MFPNPVLCDIMVNQTMANEIEMINILVPNPSSLISTNFDPTF